MPSRTRTRILISAALGVLVLASAVRIAYIAQIESIGFFRHPVSDGAIFDQRGREIAAGDWLGPADFVHAPLYAYLLGVINLVFGHDLEIVRYVQAGLGTASILFLLLACRRFFDTSVAIVAGILLAFYPPAVFFDGLIQKTSLAGFLSSCLLWLLAVCNDRSNSLRWLAAGAVLGLLGLTRQNALALAPLLLVWQWFADRETPRRHRLFASGLMIAGLAAALLPWVIRNRVVTGDFILTTPNLGQNFAMGNHPNATGTYLPFKRGRSNAEHEQREWVRAAEQAASRPLTAVGVSNYYLHSALNYIKSNPGPWMKLTARKWLMVWNAYEAPDTEDYYLYKEWSPMLRFLDRIFHFGVLCPLAAAGCVLTFTKRRALWPLYAWLLITAVAVTVFVVFARYRFPLVPVLILFAAAAVVDTARRLRSVVQKQATPDKWAPAIAVLALAGTALAANWNVYHERRPYPISYTNHAVALADGGRPDEAIAELHKAFALAPEDVDAHLVMGSVLLDQHEFEAAASHYERAMAGDPDYGGVYRGLGNALLGMGQFARAGDEFKHALALDLADNVALNGLATSIARQGRFDEAISLFERVLQSDPGCADARLNLGNTHAAAGQFAAAASAYERLLRIHPRNADALNNLAAVEAGRGRYSAAVGHYKRALDVEPNRKDAQRGLVAALIGAGQRDEAAEFTERILKRDPSRTDLRRLLDK